MMEGVMSTRLNYPCKVENQNGFTFIPESVVKKKTNCGRSVTMKNSEEGKNRQF
jgi:hypothetical protein